MENRLGKDTETAWEEDYLLDLTKPYHNLLGVVKNGTSQTFYYDNNVTAMEENGHFHYYLADELGSPLRVSDWEPPKNRAADSRNYLTYGYDEFGNDPGKELEQAGIPNPYSRQGQDQPFGYTGYRYDDISSTYFAQAREYNPKTGRFMAEDIIKGNGLIPETLNPYVYCWNNPLGLVDLDGKAPDDYVSIYYINNPQAAAGMGHTAFLLVKEDGMAEYYSYSTVSGEYIGKIFDTPYDNKEFEGRFFTYVEDFENSGQTEININTFIKMGSVNEMWYSNGEWKGKERMDTYTQAIVIPITDEQGDKIHVAAQELLYGKSIYNLWGNNCVQVARELINAGDMNLVLSKDLKWLQGYDMETYTAYATISILASFIPKYDYFLAEMAARYYEYEMIKLGEECAE